MMMTFDCLFVTMTHVLKQSQMKKSTCFNSALKIKNFSLDFKNT